jgi:general secretion pathway protein I
MMAMKHVRFPAGPRRMRGFSLIEMVAAFLVFAIGIGVLMQILTTSIHNTKQSSDYTMAALWAQSKLDTVGVGVQLDPGRSNGRFDDNYTWELSVQLVDPASVEPPPQASVQGLGNNGIQGTTQNRMTSVANAGNGGGMQASPFDLYQVDLTVYWGGRFGSNSHSAQFSTLRASNPDPNNAQPSGAAVGTLRAR